MRKNFAASLLILLCLIFVCGNFYKANAQDYSHRNVKPQLITLFSQIKHNNFARANFNFKLGVRGDSTAPRTYNNYDLRYGGNSPDGNIDWFDISNSRDSYTQIKDLGELNWNDIYDIPFLFTSSEPHNGGWKLDYGKGKDNIVITPENALVEVITGHLYLIHAKEENSAKEIIKDFYAMFRVESLKSGDEVTISWKLVPSPEIIKQ